MKKLRKPLSLILSLLMLMSMLAGMNVASIAQTTDCLSYTITDGEVTITDCDTGAEGDMIIPDTIEGYPVTAIGNSAFYDCKSLESVTIPDSVTSIDFWAFQACTSLTRVTIPDSVTSIEEGAFYYCISLESITVDINNQYYTSDDYGVLFNKDKTELIQYPVGNERTEYNIPESVTSIGRYAFYCCASLTSVTIPDGVTSIGNWAFYDCTSLESVTIPDSVTSIGCVTFSGIPYYNDESNWENGIIYMDNYLLNARQVTGNVEIRSGTKCIADGAFNLCSSLISVIIPNSVVSIGDYAFSECPALESVIIPDSVTSIGKGVFDECTSLESIIIPDGVTSIGDIAFGECKSLTSITIPNSVASIGRSAFAVCTSLENVYYSGTIAEWNNISIASNNENLTSAVIHCTDGVINSTEEPTTEESTTEEPTTEEPTTEEPTTEEPTTEEPTTEEPTTEEPTTAETTTDSAPDKKCSCICHSDSKLMQFFYKIARFFWKLFGIESKRYCECGKAHW